MRLDIPGDAVGFVTDAFASANVTVAERLCRLPNTYETSLDQTFIESLAGFGGPVQVGSGWTVRIETHFLGGGRHFGTWEIADIGLIVMFRLGGQLQLTKLALLQSKRLYPVEQPIDEAEAFHYAIGFGRLFESDAAAAAASVPRLFKFTPQSKYKMLLVGDDQVSAIQAFQRQLGAPVHYMLYNPADLPWEQEHPLERPAILPRTCRVGCRVVDTNSLYQSLTGLEGGSSPSYQLLVEQLPTPYRGHRTRAGRRVEEFVKRLVICKEGYRAAQPEDGVLSSVFTRRTGPIAAAIGIYFDAP